MYDRQKGFTFLRLVGNFLNALALFWPKLAGKIAFTLFGTPRRVIVKPAEAAFLATSDRHTEAIAGKDFAVYHWGFRGPIVLLAHGWESQSGRWRKVAPELVQAGYQVVAVDAPAHGRSSGRIFTMLHYAEVIRTLFQRLGPIDTVIAHSVGGAAAIWAMGTAAPALRPRKAVILASFSELQTVMNEARNKVGASDRMMAALDAYIARNFGEHIPFFSVARMAERLTDVDGLLIHDRKDRVTKCSESEKLQQAWPHAQLIVTEGFGHGLTAPAVNDMILEFVLDSVSA